MVGWRFWLLLAVAAIFGFWALSSLLAVNDEAPAFYRPESEDSSKPAPEQIREESREAMRDILRDAERETGGTR
ncbi:MAG: hypothetical protein P8Q97_16610 [Myxococcota bacterium]|jgi:hypothetical protein|nr:hypothetical protein [Myxococcota bacterium]